MRNTYSTTSMPDHVSVASSIFQIRVLSTFANYELTCDMIAFLKGNSKTRLWQAVD